MKIRTKFSILVISIIIGFIIAFSVFLFVTNRNRNIERESSILEDLKISYQSTRIAGSEIFTGNNLAGSMLTLNEISDHINTDFSKEDLKELYNLSPESIDTIFELKDKTLKHFNTIDRNYRQLSDFFAKHQNYQPNMIYLYNFYEQERFWNQQDWIILKKFYLDFQDDFIKFDNYMESSIEIISMQIDIIESKVSSTTNKGILFFISIFSIVIFSTVFFSFYMANSVSRDTKEIQKSLQRMIKTNSPVKIDIDKKDEMNALARDVEDIFKQFIDMQREVIQSEKMASLGHLVTGMAHELNTPLGVSITASTFLSETIIQLKENIDNNSLSKSMFDTLTTDLIDSSTVIETNINKAASIVNDFKMISIDKNKLIKNRIKAKEYLDNIYPGLEQYIEDKDIEIKIECKEDLIIYGNVGVLNQIINNLVLNAIIHGYIPEKKQTITISLLQDETNNILLVENTGNAIPTENIKKIFDPFYTTQRGNHGGLGLGLNIVYNLVNSALKGSINCISNKKEGTEFIIRFPL